MYMNIVRKICTANRLSSDRTLNYIDLTPPTWLHCAVSMRFDFFFIYVLLFFRIRREYNDGYMSSGAIVGGIRMHTRPHKYFPLLADKRAREFFFFFFLRFFMAMVNCMRENAFFSIIYMYRWLLLFNLSALLRNTETHKRPLVLYWKHYLVDGEEIIVQWNFFFFFGVLYLYSSDG